MVKTQITYATESHFYTSTEKISFIRIVLAYSATKLSLLHKKIIEFCYEAKCITRSLFITMLNVQNPNKYETRIKSLKEKIYKTIRISARKVCPSTKVASIVNETNPKNQPVNRSP